MTTIPISWPEAQRICDIPEVREALDKFAVDACEDHMLAMVSAIIGHALAAGPVAVGKIMGADEYGPMIEWRVHWADLIGRLLYASRSPAVAQPEPTPPDVRPDTVMAKPMPINALWDAIGVYCEAVIDDELAACGIGDKVDPRMRIGAAKRLIDLIGDRTDHDAPAQPANRLHKDAHLSPAVAQPVADEREAFEKWFAADTVPGSQGFFSRDQSNPDEYSIFEVQCEWRAWQARAALCQQAKEVRPVDCTSDPQCCPQNEGHGCHCSALAAKDKP